MIMSACAPPPFEAFLSPNPSFDQSDTQPEYVPQKQEPEYQPGSSDSFMAVETSPSGSSATILISQLHEALTEAEARVSAGEARMQEESLLDAMREFERARLLIEQDIDPTLQYIESQSSVQGGIGILSTSRIQQVQGQRENLLSRINSLYDFLHTLDLNRKEQEKVSALRKANKPMLQPISLSESPQVSRASRLLISPRPKPQPLSISSTLNLKWLSDDEINPYIVRFQQRHADFRSCLVRANQYFPQVMSLLNAEGIPEDIAYIALIESGFQPSAKSSSGDTGLWQLSRSTARSYGLSVTSRTDDRADIQSSTRAFARYMSDLYRRFGSWELAIMAYDVGERTLQNTINRLGSYDLHRMESYSPGRTYLAKLAAGIAIAKNPISYGFDIDLGNVTDHTVRTGEQASSATPMMMLEPPVAILY